MARQPSQPLLVVLRRCKFTRLVSGADGLARTLRCIVALLYSLHCCAADGSPVWSFDYHGDALFGWNEARRAKELHDEGPWTLVHFDTHADMAVPPEPFAVDGSLSSLDLALNVDINSFIPPAVLLGIVDRVVWVRPEWAFEGQAVGHDVFEMGVNEDGSWAANSSFGGPADMHENLENLSHTTSWTLDTIEFSTVSLQELRERLRREAEDEGRSWILDVDLDVFSSENSGVQSLRDFFYVKEEDILEIVDCACFPTSSCDDPVVYHGKRFPGRLAEVIEPGIALQQSMANICDTPVHYATTDDVQDSMATVVDWIGQLHDEGVDPAVTTICSSTTGYQPPQYVSQTSMFVDLVSERLGTTAHHLECTLCCSFTIMNDMQETFDVIYFNAETMTYTLLQIDWRPGEEFNTKSYLKHVFFFRSDTLPRRYKRTEMREGQGYELKLNTSELPWLPPGEMVPAPGGDVLKVHVHDEL
eukprot:TRINITY_DN56991_c0_g1_i1.p1 TRINITY_DN56991_c0_g1~~TRINITY_DN56991_c0_g1_i1.p1  ORF type:complete len:474 (-),score=71.27 TRINITY_DN56991_c0_g1_i1:110-1531(-)